MVGGEWGGVGGGGEWGGVATGAWGGGRHSNAVLCGPYRVKRVGRAHVRKIRQIIIVQDQLHV